MPMTLHVCCKYNRDFHDVLKDHGFEHTAVGEWTKSLSPHSTVEDMELWIPAVFTNRDTTIVESCLNNLQKRQGVIRQWYALNFDRMEFMSIILS